MKKWIIFIAVFLMPFLIWSSPCFEEVEAIVLSTISSKASIPEIKLKGVKIEGDEDYLIPHTVEYDKSDVSTYLKSLSTKPEITSIWDNALYNLTQRNPTMVKTKEILEDMGYKKGEVIVDGSISIEALSDPKTIEIVMGNDLSSINVSASLDLTLKIKSKRYIIKGTVLIEGDNKRILSVTSTDISVNDTYYKVSVKYKLTKV